MIKKLFIFFSISNLLFSFDPFYLNDKSRTPIERGGDFVQVLLPIGGLSATKILKDKDGSKQFWQSFISSVGTTYLLKVAIDKERPNGHCCESFPSGHTTSAFAGAMFIYNRYGAEYGIPSLALASFVGYSRVYAKKHYWIDVFCGAAIGVIGNMLFTKEQVSPIKATMIKDIYNGYRLNFNFAL